MRQVDEGGPIAGTAGGRDGPLSEMVYVHLPVSQLPKGARRGGKCATTDGRRRAGLRSEGGAVFGTLSAEKTSRVERRRQSLADGEGTDGSGSYDPLYRPGREVDRESSLSFSASVHTASPHVGGDGVSVPMELTLVPR